MGTRTHTKRVRRQGSNPYLAELYPNARERHQHLWTFANGRGASVVQGYGTYGASEGLWELAVLDRHGRLDYSTPVTDDVVGYLTPADVRRLLRQIEALP